MLRQSVLLRMFLVAFIGIGLLIPITLVQSLIHERNGRRDEAVKEISDKWGQAQTIAGPILTVPVRSTIRGEKGSTTYRTDYLHCLPENLIVRSQLIPQIRYRGIYRVVLYSARVDLRAQLDYRHLNSYENPDRHLLWEEAFLTVGIRDLKGISSVSELKWDSADLSPNPGLRNKDVVQVGFTAFPKIDPSTGLSTFSMKAGINGSGQIQIVPLGKTTEFEVSSAWGAPSFIGSFLPESRNVTAQSFSATWKILHLNRNYPQLWWNQEHSVDSSAFGVRLLLPVDEYQKNSRSVKYAAMFILLIFIAFLMTDILTGTALHPIQYALVSFALVLFYVLLLSLSEHISFNASYLVASLTIVVTVSLYTKAITGRGAVAGLIAGLLTAQYAFLFLLMQLEDWSLLLGSIGLFVILVIVMYLTRKIDWFDAGRRLQPGLEEKPRVGGTRVP